MVKTFIALLLNARFLTVAFGDPRIMIESTYTNSTGLNDLAKTAWQEKGGKYMGTATDVKQLDDPFYIEQLENTSDFGMITPINAMQVRVTTSSRHFC